MSNRTQLLAAVATLEAAQAAFTLAETEYVSVDTAANAAVETERGVLVAASDAYEAALETARENVDWTAKNLAYVAAQTAREAASTDVRQVAAEYDGS